MLKKTDPQSGFATVELPSGFIDASGNVHDEAMIREMTGVEEDILAGSGPMLNRINTIIENCTIKIGSIEDRQQVRNALMSLPAGDRLALLIGMREISLGSGYDIQVECENQECGRKNDITVDLSEMLPKKVEGTARSFTDTLPSGGTVVWEVLTGRDEVNFQPVDKKLNGESRLTRNILMRVRSIQAKGADAPEMVQFSGGQFRRSMDLLKGLSMRDRDFLRKRFKEAEPDVDTEVSYECPSCGHEWSGNLDLGQTSFFFPSGI